ncbi:MAG: protein-L-isoaspartate O-methyltransferase family protein [Burkholderiales bacterium]|jgi:protein-L-isoaspartate(D-aspartate) O-methyltransferase
MLAQATRDAERMRQPVGVGLDSPAVRARMVQRLLADGLAGEVVLEAMGKVPRHRFVDSALAQQAYEDTSLPIGFGQTISKPSAVARMLQLLMEGETARRQGNLGRVLEIGTGCGYQAAVLSLLARSLVSLERIGGLHVQAKTRMEHWCADAKLRLSVRLVHVDGRAGDASHGPFDSIIAAAGGEALPETWLAQLAPGGRLVAPVVEGAGQVLAVVDHRTVGGRSMLEHSRREAVAFVPLKSGLG